MSLGAKEFFEVYGAIKKFVGEGGGSDELKRRFESLKRLLGDVYDAESFKSALAENKQIPTPLEEELTSAKMLFLLEQSRR